MKMVIYMKKNIIVSILIIVLLFFLLYIFINDNRKLTKIETILKDGFIFIERVIDVPINFIDKEIKEMSNKNNIYKKYKKLKEKYDSLELNYKKYDETLKELNSLKENNNLKNTLIDYEIIDSYVINRNVGYWYDTLTIDKGSLDGIKKDMAVINSKGLIGKITKTTNTTSTVKLLTGLNENNRISVKIKVDDTYLYGLLSNYKDNYFILEGISDNREIKEDSIITTTGLDNLFPSGIEIGYFKKSITDDFELSRTIYVKPLVNFDNIDYVMVLKRGNK